MAWKEFLKPDWKKLLIFLISISLVTIFLQPSDYSGIEEETYYFAFPLISIIKIGRDCVPCGLVARYAVDYLGLVTNLIFWYIISSAVITLYDMVK